MRFFITFEDKSDEREFKGIVYKMRCAHYSFNPRSLNVIKAENGRIGGKRCCVVSVDDRDCFQILLGKYYPAMLRGEGVKIYDAKKYRCLTRYEQDELSAEEKKLLPKLTFDLAAAA